MEPIQPHNTCHMFAYIFHHYFGAFISFGVIKSICFIYSYNGTRGAWNTRARQSSVIVSFIDFATHFLCSAPGHSDPIQCVRSSVSIKYAFLSECDCIILILLIKLFVFSSTNYMCVRVTLSVVALFHVRRVECRRHTFRLNKTSIYLFTSTGARTMRPIGLMIESQTTTTVNKMTINTKIKRKVYSRRSIIVVNSIHHRRRNDISSK